jgi:hypothetical protein
MSTLDNIHLRIFFNSLSLLDHLSLVDFTSFILDTWFAIFVLVNIDVHDIILMEFLSPSLRDSILDLILELIHIWVLRQSLSDRLLMKLIKFIIELSNHLLDVLSFFFLVELINDSLLDVFLCVA